MTKSSAVNYFQSNKAFYIGLLICLFIYLPILILNLDMKVIIHDEFDGELLTYRLQTMHLFDDNIPELFNGAGKESMTPAAPGFVLIYKLFSTRVSFFTLYLFIVVVAYAGMFLCVRAITGSEWIAVIVGVLFSLLPFYAVYGLTVMGQPLLVYAFLCLWERKERLKSYIFIALFAINSSLILVGYAFVFLIAICAVIGVIIRKKQSIPLILGWIELLLLYIFTDVELIRSIAFPSAGFVTHKTDWTADAEPVIETFKSIFFHGYYHCASKHELILFFSTIVFCCSLIVWKKISAQDKNRVVCMGALLLGSFCIACFCAVWSFKPVVDIRNEIGGIFIYFQADRVYWLYPTIWFLILGFTIYLIHRLLKDYSKISLIVITFVVATNVLFIGSGSTIAGNVKALIGNSDKTVFASIDEFYQPRLFSDIDRFIGQEKKDYRVCSVGLYPSIALYNGYYCIDGYSNNYDISYKRQFRKVIARELEKDKELKSYFDDWGNRCYVFSSELGKDFYVDKFSKKAINHLDIDTRALKELNCQFIFSAVPINNDHLSLLKKFESDSSYYDVYLYKIENED